MKNQLLQKVVAMAVVLGSTLVLHTSAFAQGMQYWMWKVQIDGQCQVGGYTAAVTRPGLLYVTTPLPTADSSTGQNTAEVALISVEQSGQARDLLVTNTGLLGYQPPVDVAYFNFDPSAQSITIEFAPHLRAEDNAFRFVYETSSGSVPVECQVDWGRMSLWSGDGFSTVAGWVELYGCEGAGYYAANISGAFAGTAATPGQIN